MRLNKFLAHAGVSSRRKCDEIIFSGKIKVNGKIVKSPGFKIDISKDCVEVSGKKIVVEKKIYIALNKPKNVLSTVKDSFNRKIITDLIPMIKERVYPVGRLDIDTTGLILLTNDGELANRLIHPRYKVEKTYKVLVKGRISLQKVDSIKKGVILEDGKKTLPAKCKILKTSPTKSMLLLTIKEGRKRQVKNMFKYVKHPVIRLQRVQFGPIKLGELKEGEWRYLTNQEVEILYNMTGLNNC